jgi:ADP-heptose:LPS heptosyltransferase
MSGMKILLVRNDHLGDLVLSLPVCGAVKRGTPDCELHLLAADNLREIPAMVPAIDRVMSRTPGESIEALAERLNRERYDLLLSFPATRENARLARRLQIPVKIGHASKSYNWFAFNRFVTLRRSHPPVHETDFMLAFVHRAGLSATIDPEFRIDCPSVSAAVRRLESVLPDCPGFVTIHPGSRGSAENLPFDSWLALTKGMSRASRTAILFVLGPDERSLEQTAREALVGLPNVRVLSGCSLTELAGILSLADLTVSASTGPMHLAAALGTHTYSFFSSRLSQSPAKWKPIGQNAIIDQPPEGKNVGQTDTDAAVLRIIASLDRTDGSSFKWGRMKTGTDPKTGPGSIALDKGERG